jgi:hypothetical protein
MPEADRRRRVRNTALCLAAFAIALYTAFIIFSIQRGS